MNLTNLLDELLIREGGFVNDPKDRGGATKYGITQATLSKHLGHQASVEEVKTLSSNVAKEIYLADYYHAPRFHLLPEPLQPQMFDIGVNSGPPKAVRMLQEVCTMAGFECTVDGILGPTTRGVVERAYASMGNFLINALEEYREHFYNTIVENDPTQSKFLKGWLYRSKQFRVET
jgi:lysozyme family protein